ncbi:MAG TPA: 50S ribosomal protein L28 [Phycisphaerales bacterium]|nr:50S ribosomal protein L28 [Phycisphaerales bacterium]
MPAQCHFTGKKVTMGNRISRSGAAVKSGGFGLKTSGISRRSFKPNLQKLTIVDEGKVKTVKVSVKAIRSGLVVKPLKRKYGYTAKQKASQH